MNNFTGSLKEKEKNKLLQKQAKLFLIIFEYNKLNQKINNIGKLNKLNVQYGILLAVNLKRLQSQLNLMKKKSEQVKDQLQMSEILTNLEQIKYFQWCGNYGQNSQKVDRWTGSWNQITLEDVGGYYSIVGKKEGLWKELSQNYQGNDVQIYDVGKYINNQRRGTWKFIYDNKQIGGGNYNNQGKKNGKWIELSQNFQNISLIIYKGEYINGKKYGIWDILYKRNANKSFKLIAFGFYDQQDKFIDSIKIGRWIEPDDGFWNLSQVINIGEYKYGKKVGLWDIKYRISDNKSFQIIGGGYYKQLEDNSVLGSFKNGKWIELTDGFWRDKQVTYYGEYLNGYKVGKWDIYYNDQETEQNEYIGGGSYVEKIIGIDIQSFKNGKWIELSDTFNSESQVIYKGEYYNGKKVGRWDIFYKNEQIGGGQYDNDLVGDQNSDSIKIGSWVELIDGFYEYGQITMSGQYVKGKKLGIWQWIFGNQIMNEEKYSD